VTGVAAAGPPENPGGEDTFRLYSPAGSLDGTAHLTAALSSVAHHSEGVLRNLHEARKEGTLLGRYGFSSVNLDRGWAARNMVGIDAGAAALAPDNDLMANRVRAVFHGLPCVQRALGRLGLTCAEPAVAAVRLAS
jgi:hypothetical protein